jgi:MFS family permease
MIEPKEGMRAIPTRVRLLVYTQILNTLGFGYFSIYISVFLVQTQVLNAFGVGLLFGIETIVLIIAGIPLGMLSDRRGRKWFLIAGNFILPPTFLIFALTTNFSWYLFAAALAGVGEALALGSWNAIIADQTDLRNRDAAFSLSFIVSNAFTSVGFALPFGLPALSAALGLGEASVHAGTLLVIGVLNFVAPVFIWLLLRGYHEAPRPQATDEGSGELRMLVKFSAFNGLIGLGAGLIIPLLGTWMLYKFAVPDTYSGPLLAAASITIAFAAIMSPRLSKKYGLFTAILMTMGSSTFFMLSLAFIPNVIFAAGFYLIRASLMNMASPLMDSYLMSIIRPARRGLGSAVAAIVWRLPNSATTIVGGFILYLGFTSGNRFLYDLPWILASLFYMLGIGLLYLNFKNVKPKG